MARSTADKDEAEAMLAEAMANTQGPLLSPEQTLAMFALVARQGVVAQNDLGVPLDASDRTALETAALVEVRKREQNALWLEMTDAGWAWVAANLTKAVPPSHSVVHQLLVRIDAHLAETGEELRAFIGTATAGPMDPELTGKEAGA